MLSKAELVDQLADGGSGGGSKAPPRPESRATPAGAGSATASANRASRAAAGAAGAAAQRRERAARETGAGTEPRRGPSRLPRRPSGRGANAVAAAGAGAARTSASRTSCCRRPGRGRSSTPRAARPAPRCCAKSPPSSPAPPAAPTRSPCSSTRPPRSSPTGSATRPQVEIVSAGQARHAGDAIAQAARRAEGGEDVIVLIDSLSRFAEAFKAANEAKELFDAGPGRRRRRLADRRRRGRALRVGAAQPR